MRTRFLFAIVLLVLLSSCSTVSFSIKYPKPDDDVYANSNLKNFFSTTKHPSIVLRASNSNDKITSNINKQNAVLYNAIEKELLKQGFSVRDRGLFNEVIGKASFTDYSKIKDLTNTDLILEIVNIDPEVLYSTNKVNVTRNGKTTEQLDNIDYKKYGAAAEFRLIMVNNNEIAGTYKYNYQPCPDGCNLASFKVSAKRNNKENEIRETMSVSTLEEFITICTKDLITSFRS